MFVWTTVVYDPIAFWTWNPNGWSFQMGGLDYAGGTPVHISSGAAALAMSVMLGKRAGYAKSAGLPYRPHNVTMVVLGTVFLWVGWFGFNGGSALGANIRAVMSLITTHLAASMGGLTWMLLDYRLDRKWSVVGFCSGAISGLVAITPGAGFVTPWAAVVFGIVGGIACNFATVRNSRALYPTPSTILCLRQLVEYAAGVEVFWIEKMPCGWHFLNKAITNSGFPCRS